MNLGAMRVLVLRLAVLLLGLTGVSGNTLAQSFGRWAVVDADDQSGDAIALTATDSKFRQALGYRCFRTSQECVFVLIAGTACSEESSYPMLLNSSSGASLVTGTCFQGEGLKNQLVLKPHDEIKDSITSSSGLVGIAIPMASGEFLAVRFSVEGADRAISEAIRRASDRRGVTRSPLRRQPGASTF